MLTNHGYAHKIVLGILIVSMVIQLPLAAQTIDYPEDKRNYFWLGFGLGIGQTQNDDDLLAGDLHFSVQFNKKFYTSLYRFAASRVLSDGDTFDEYGVMLGICRRSRNHFRGASAGVALVNSTPGGMSIGLPLRLEYALIIGDVLALGVKVHGTLASRSHFGWTVGLEIGKMR